MTLTVGSLFTGIGGFDAGLERAGCRIEWQCEADPSCSKLLGARWPDVPCHPDVRTLDGRTLSPVELICGGFPCQDVSVAGNRAGLAGERSGLFAEFMRLVDSLAPRWVLIENVPGLLSSGHVPGCADPKCSSCAPGADMATVTGVLADLGYGWAYRVLDAQYFGVAQRRRRVFIVGCLGDPARATQVLFEPESCGGDSAPRREAGQGLTAGVAACLNSGGNAGGFRTEPGEHLVPSLACALTASERWDGDTETFVPIAFQERGREGGRNLEAQENLAYALTAPNGGGRRHELNVLTPVAYSTKLHNTASNQAGKFYEEYAPSLQADSPPPAVAFSENQRGEVLETPYSRQLTTGGGKPGQGYSAVRQEMAVRRLTPKECERLQGFPDGWTEGFADSVRYRMLGNAVCTNVVEWIGRRIVAVDQKNKSAAA